MLRAGDSRRRVAMTLNAAYGDGLLSEKTLAHRLEVLFGSAVIDPAGLIGDLSIRVPRRSTLLRRLSRARHAAARRAARPPAQRAEPTVLLALDWTGAQEELLLGRHPACDVVLTDLSVSRRHARLSFRDGNWVVRDLESTNGTIVNGTRIVRCRLLPGDRLTFGEQVLVVD